jgi:hypothetical protein
MFQHLLETIAKCLDQANLPYMVIGGQAVLLYGEPRLTKDIDVTLGAGLERLQEVVTAVRQIGLVVLVDPEQFTRQTMVLPCSHPPTGIRIDLIFSYSSFEQQAIAHSTKVMIGETQVSFASLEDLIIHKIIAGRARDLEDVKSVLLKNPQMNASYVRHWLEQFSSALGADFVKLFDGITEESG